MINYTKIKHGNDLLNFLIEQSDYATIDDLKVQLNLSRRGVFYVLKRVNEALLADDLEPVTNILGAGYYIQSETKKSLLEHFSDAQATIDQLSKHQRCQLIIWELINHQALSLTHLAARFNVSKHTVISDLRQVRQTLATHRLEIVQGTTGKFLAGSEITQRNWVLEALNDRSSILYSQIDINPSRLIAINTEIHKLEKITGNYFTDDALSTLDEFILWFLDRIKDPQNQLPDSPSRRTTVDSSSIDWSINFLAANDVQNYSEAYFLGRIINTSQFYRVNKTDGLIQRIFPIAREIIDRFNAASSASISPDKLELTLSTHLLSAFYRSKFMIPYHHPNLEQITEGYQELFSFTKYAIRPFEKFINGQLSDDEIALIALYFGGELRSIENEQTVQTDVLVVCSSGIGTSYILQQQLTQRFPNIAFSQPLSVFQFKNHDLDHIKLIISTIKLTVPLEIPVVTVSPLPNHRDWETIGKALVNAHLSDINFNEARINALLDIISNYARIEDFDGLTGALHGYLNQSKHPHQAETDETLSSLQRLLPTAHIKYSTDVLSWQQGVKIALSPLLHDGLIHPHYLEQVINLTQKNGPYMVLGDGIMLAHATQNDGVNDLGMSLLLCQHPMTIQIEGHTPAKKIQLIIGLAPVDATSHLAALSQLLQKIQDVAWVKAIKATHSVAEISHLLEVTQM